ncbi:MAG: hypothetical protein RLP44_11230 [Aggregatilineales bacterium]
MTLVDVVALVLVVGTFMVLGVIPVFAMLMKDDSLIDDKDVQSNEC